MRFSSSMLSSVAMMIVVVVGMMRARGWLRLAHAYGHSAATNAVKNLRQTELDLFEEQTAGWDAVATCDRNETSPLSAEGAGSRGAIVIIPGFGSSRLRATQEYECSKHGFGLGRKFLIGDDVWMDASRAIGIEQNCWLSCLLQDTCRARPIEGLDAIVNLSPGLFGHFSEVFGSFIGGLVKVGYEPVKDIIALPYDWRLSPKRLEDRDKYFTIMRRKIELMVETHKTGKKTMDRRVTIVAHSMGNNVFRYFLEWMKNEVGLRNYKSWIDNNIGEYVAVSGSFLGSPDAAKGVISGHTFGSLPVSKEKCRKMAIASSSSPWMLPNNLKSLHDIFHARRDDKDTSKDEGGDRHHGVRNWKKLIKGSGSWPIPLSLSLGDLIGKTLNIVDGKTNASLIHEGTLLISPDDLFRSEVMESVSSIDPEFTKVKANIEAAYQFNPLDEESIDSLRPWVERPPIDRVVCAFGTDKKTALSHSWKLTPDKSTNRRWEHVDTVWEDMGGKLSQSAESAQTIPDWNGMGKSGDGVVPYFSLSFCHAWLPDKVNATRVPQDFHTPSEVFSMHDVSSADFNEAVNEKVALDILEKGEVYKEGKSKLYDTFYEASSLNPEGKFGPQHTYVWEFGGVNHREILRTDIFLRELVAETIWSQNRFMQIAQRFRQVVFEEMISTSNTRRSSREPTTDDQCYWDYWEARCALPTYCTYLYRFGDIHLSQSCRLRQESPPPDLDKVDLNMLEHQLKS